MAQIPILTSIPPKWSRPSNGRNFGPAWQQLCISSWKASGFRPISLNSAAEIEAFRMLPIEFQSVPRARPSIADMIDAAKKSGSRIAGIVNADCTTIPFLDLSAALESLLDNGVVIVERLNISQHDLRPTGQHCFGFDAFFFTINSLEKIQWSEDWKIGGVWWDYCFPLAFAAAGQKIRTLPSPGLIHLDHDRRWTMEEWQAAMPKLISAVDQVDLALKTTMPATATFEDEEAYAPFIRAVFDWLRSRETLYTPEFESVEELITLMLTGMLSQPQPLTVKQLARQLPGASVRAARRILGRP